MIILLALLVGASPARADDGLVDTSEIEDILSRLDEQYAPYVEDFSLRDAWREIVSGDYQSAVAMVTDLLKSLVVGQIAHNGGLLAQMLVLSILALLLSVLKDSFAGGQISLLSRWVVYILLFSMALISFSDLMQSAREAVEMISDLVLVLLPVMLPLLAALGSVGTVATISPVLLLAFNLLMAVMNNIIFPLIWFFAVLKLVGQLAPRFSVSRLAALSKDVALGLMSIVTTLFVALLSIFGVASAGRDGIAMKAAKTASGAFIPVVGRTISDTLDSVLGTVLVLKSGIGLIGALGLLLICVVPAIQMLAQALLFRLAGAMVQPLGDEMLAEALTGMGNSLILLFAALVVSGLFAFFSLALVVVMGNVTMMVR